MSIFKINFVPTKLPPQEKKYVIGQIYTYEARAETFTCEYRVKFSTPGDYELEYWAVDDVGNEEPRKRIAFSVVGHDAKTQNEQMSLPAINKINESLQDAIIEKGKIQVIFSKTPDGMGTDFKWADLNVCGLQLESEESQQIIKIVPGSWLARRLNNFKNAIKVSVLHGQDIVLMLSTPRPLTQNGELISNLPKLLLPYIDKVYKENGRLSFIIRCACSLKVLS